MLALTVDPGIWTLMDLLIGSDLIPLLFTKDSVTKEWEAPESNNTCAGTELTANVPRMTSADSWASSAWTWLRRPRLALGLPGWTTRRAGLLWPGVGVPEREFGFCLTGQSFL